MQTRIAPASIFSIGDASITEGNSGTVMLNFTVTRTGDTSTTVVLGYTTADGTATAGSDYTAVTSGTVTIASGETTGIIRIAVTGDTLVELNETFTVRLTGILSADGLTASFADQQTFATGLDPRSLTLGDVNGDGLLDLVVSNYSSNTVSVLLNTTTPGDSTPSFADRQTFATAGSNPRAVSLGDINGDGLLDLIVANRNGNSVSVLLNMTTPGGSTLSFATQQSFAAGISPYSVSLGDINGDGLLDLVVANENSNTVSVLLNTTTVGGSTPSFAPQQTFATGNNPSSVSLGDINGDGLLDLVVANRNGNSVSVLLNMTTPGASTSSFADQQTFATGVGPRSVSLGDVNGDNKPDLIVANSTSNTVSVLLNTTTTGGSTSSFITQQTFATGNTPFSVSLGDLDGDGLLDLAVTNLNSNTVSVLLNTTTPGTIALTPSFATQQTFPTGVRPFSVSLGDVNGDGLIDLVIANQASNTVSVIQNTTPQPEIGNAVGTGTILNDDIATVSISSTRGIEGTNLVATATLSQVVDVDVTVTLTPSIQMGDTARASDLSLAPQTITIAAGQLTSSISIPTNDNTIVDGTRIFTLSLSNLSAMGRDVTLGVATTTGIILDNDGAPVDPPVIPPGSSNTRLYAVAAGSGGGPRVLVFNADGSLRFEFFAFSPDFLGGVSVATADIDGDTIDDIIVGAGPGGGPIVSVFRGTDQSLLTSFFALPQQFTGGVQVSAEDGGLIAIGAGPGGGPVVTLFQVTGSTVTMVNSFFAFSPLFTGGVSVGLEGTTLVVGAGAGGGPVVSVFNALTGAFQSSFFAFDATFTGGVSVAASTINGQLSILVGPGLGAAPAGQFNAQGQLQQAFSLPGSLGGIRVGFADRDGDGIDDTVLLGSGLFVPSTLRLLDLDGDELESLSPFGSVFTGGIFVG